MSLSTFNEKIIAEFFTAIELRQGAYRNCRFSYLALKQGSDFRLILGRLFFVACRRTFLFRIFGRKTFALVNIRCPSFYLMVAVS